MSNEGLLALDRVPGVAEAFLERGLVPDIRHHYPAPLSHAEVCFGKIPPDGLFTGNVCVDGSGKRSDPVLRRIGCGAVMVNEVAEAVAEMHVAVPVVLQTTPAAETFLIYLVLQQCCFRSRCGRIARPPLTP